MAGMMMAMACAKTVTFTPEELQRIGDSPEAGLMVVLQSDNEADSLQLRRHSEPLTEADLRSDAYRVLKARLLETVQDPEHPGVGIAAPQVGVLKQLVVVQRFDREGEPFEFYPNPFIEAYSEEVGVGPEGCLSVPDRSEEVVRSRGVRISYWDEQTQKRVEEVVTGFTAVIFQHEIDHLNGVLYIDRIADQGDSGEAK